MHKVIQHVEIVSRLQCWAQYANEKFKHESLKNFAMSELTWEELVVILKVICIEKVATTEIDAMCQRKPAQCDESNENCLIHEQYFLLYEEISHAMNIGDIGQLELCFVDWAVIFKGCGKHKYAAELIRYLCDVHFVYPPGLKYGSITRLW
jgi:hypothetical protein